MLQELLQQEQEVGRYESSGQFTLDLNKAAEKLGRWQADEPLFFILKLVQAAVAAGAREIRLSQTRDIIELKALGVSESQFDLPTLSERLLTARLQHNDLPKTYLASGLAAALASGASRWLCTVGEQRLLLAEGRLEHARYPGPSGTFSVALQGCRVRLGRKPLQERLAYAPLPIYFGRHCLNYLIEPLASRQLTQLSERGQGVACAGAFLSQKIRYRDELPQAAAHSFELPFCAGHFRWRNLGRVPICQTVLQLMDPKQDTRVVLVKHGVALSSSLTVRLPGAVCVVSASGLQLDVSTLQVVHNAALDRLRDELESALRRFYRDLIDIRTPPTPTPNAEPDLGRAIVVALGLILAVVLVVTLATTGDPGTAAGCLPGGCGCGGIGGSTDSSPPEDELSLQLREILSKYQGAPGR